MPSDRPQMTVDTIADAICEALASWLKEPLHRMAYTDAARAAIMAGANEKQPD